MKERVSEPADKFEFVIRMVERVDLLGIKDDRLSKLRAALAKAGDDDTDSDGEAADLLVNPQPAQDSIRRRFGDGDLDLDQARQELIALQARAAADEVLSKMMTNVAAQRRAAVWTAATQVPWEAVLVPIGRKAADRVNELAPRLPADQSDQSIAGLDKSTRAANDEFREALGRYRGVVSLLLELRWNKVLKFDPLSTDEVQFQVPSAEWYYGGIYGSLATERKSSFVEELQHGAVAAVPLPHDIEALMEARADLRDASIQVARQGWPIPGVDVPADHVLPRNVRDQLPQRVKRAA